MVYTKILYQERAATLAIDSAALGVAMAKSALQEGRRLSFKAVLPHFFPTESVGEVVQMLYSTS